MPHNITDTLFLYIRGALTSKTSPTLIHSPLTSAELDSLKKLAKKHDVAHLLAAGLSQCAWLPAQSRAFVDTEIMQAMYRCEYLTYELQHTCDTLEKNSIPYLPLKGSVLRHYYPEPWMRTSCDIDILIQKKDANRAAACLADACGYTGAHTGDHAITMQMKNGMGLELHYTLLPKHFARSYSSIVQRAWDFAIPRPDSAYGYEMPDEFFYFYHIAHMAKHFELGGCGIRSLIDLWMLDHLPNADTQKRDTLLQEGGLLPFAEAARQLSRVWMAEEEHTPLTTQMERFILAGGVYGTMQNSVLVQNQRKGGKGKYLLSRIFLPYDRLCFQFPYLQQHKWLTPIFQFIRWSRLLLPGKSRRALLEFNESVHVSNETAADIRRLLKDLSL